MGRRSELCARARLVTLLALASGAAGATYNSARISAPWGSVGPPYLYSCSDQTPLYQFVSGSSSSGAPTATTAATNGGSAAGAPTNSSAAWSASMGGVVVSSPGTFTTPVMTRAASGVFAVSAWISVAWSTAFATSMYPVLALGGATPLYLWLGVGALEPTGALTLNACVTTNKTAVATKNVTSCAALAVGATYMFPKPLALQTSPGDWTHLAFAVQTNSTAPFNSASSVAGYSLYVNGVSAAFCSASAAVTPRCTLAAPSTYYNASGSSYAAVGASVAQNATNATSAFLTGLVLGDLQVYATDGTFTPAALFAGDACAGASTAMTVATMQSTASTLPRARPMATVTSAGIPFSFACADIPPISLHISRASNASDLASVISAAGDAGALNYSTTTVNPAAYASNIAWSAAAGGWTPANLAVSPWTGQGCVSTTNVTASWSPLGATSANTISNCLSFASQAGYTWALIYSGGVCAGCVGASCMTNLAQAASCGLAAPACDPYCGTSGAAFAYAYAGNAPPPAAPPPMNTSLLALLSGAPVAPELFPSFFLTPRVNLAGLVLTQYGNTLPTNTNGVLVSAWVKNAGGVATTNGFQQIMTLGSGLSLSAQLAANGSIALCVTGFHPYDTNVVPSNCSSSTAAYLTSSAVTVSPAANANGWIHLAWAAKAVSGGIGGYYLYANGQLVAAQTPASATGTLLPFNAYYDGSLQRVGFNFLVNDFNNKLYFAELQVYGVPNGDDAAGGNAAALYLGGECTSYAAKFSVAATSLVNSVYEQEYGPAHRFTFTALNVSGAAASWTSATLVDAGRPGGWGAVAGSLPPWVNAYGVQDVGALLSNGSAYLDLGAADYGFATLSAAQSAAAMGTSTESSASPSAGVAFSFWLTRTEKTVGANATRLLTVVGNTYDDYAYSVGLTPRGGATAHTVDVSWPACQGNAAFVSVLPNGTLNTAGLHHVLVAHSMQASLQVFVDGLPASYRSQSAAGLLCDLAFSTWPSTFAASNFYVGSYSTADAGTFALVDFSVYVRELGAADATAIWNNGPPGQANAVLPPPPPLSAPTTPTFALPKMAACTAAPPIHRYGDFNASVQPFAGGVLADANTSAPWPAVWRSFLAPTTVAANSYITLGSLTTYYSNGAYIDVGTQTFTGSGLSVGMLVSNTALAAAACTPTAAFNSTLAQAAGAPSSWALFDIGGYTVYAVAYSCAAGYTNGVPNVATVVTSPGGASSSFQGAGTARSPLLPMVNERYTFVTFGATATRIYVNGALWAVFPTVTYAQQQQFVAPSVRLFLGDMHNNGTALTITARASARARAIRRSRNMRRGRARRRTIFNSTTGSCRRRTWLPLAEGWGRCAKDI